MGSSMTPSAQPPLLSENGDIMDQTKKTNWLIISSDIDTRAQVE